MKVSPLKSFWPVRVSVPAPVEVRAPAPLKTPLKRSVLLPLSIVPPPGAFRVTVLAEVTPGAFSVTVLAEVMPAVVRSVPPLKVRAPLAAPRLASLAIDSVPAVMVVPPE